MDQKTAFDGSKTEKKVLLALEKGAVIIYGDPEERQKGAIIRPGKGIDIFLNGTRVADHAEVFPGDQVEIKPREEVQADKLEVKISDDRLKAEAQYSVGFKESYTVSDYPPTDDLVVEGIAGKEKTGNLTSEELMKNIRAEGVAHGLDPFAISGLLTEEGAWQTVAVGDPVRQGKDGWVEPLFEAGFKSVTYGQEESQVDFRKRFEIVQASEGGTIALIHPPVPGTPGKAVTGEEIQPDPVKKVEINCDRGTALSSDQTQVLATRKGVPTYKKGRMHSFRVEDIYTHNGDVDIKSGNIDFRGHFKVQGAVTEGMKVSADGNIEIGENASGAAILAGGNILFKGNCIKCTVQAGWVNMVLKNIYATLDRMEGSVGSALLASEEVAKALEAKGKHSEQMESAVIRALLQSKYSELPEYAASLMKSLKDVGRSLPEKLVLTINDIAPYFVDFQYSQTLGRPALKEIKNKLAGLQVGRQVKVEPADITAPYLQNSILHCTGNIIVSGPGSYNSRLKCEGDVNISRLFRGGSIEAGRDVYIGEAGAPRITADQGLIQVPYKGRVHIGTAYENIRIRFGSTDYRFEKNLKNVRVVLDQQDFEVKILHWEK